MLELSQSIPAALLSNPTCCLNDALSTNQNKDGSRVGVAFDLVKPKVGNAVKGLLICYVIDEEDGIGTYYVNGVTFVVSIGDGPEPLLAGSIPDLELDILAVGVDCLEPEIYSDGGHVVFIELVVSEPEQEAALADR